MTQQFEPISRVSVPALDDILGQPIKALDDGFVRVVDYMGGDSSIVQAARVSYGAGTKSVRDDATLIRYLMRHHHTTPFEMATIRLHVRVPMDTWRQWIRHRTMSVNEYSTRYSLAIDAAQKTAPGEWRMQSDANRQGSGDYLYGIEPGSARLSSSLSAQEADLHGYARRVYNERIEVGISREQARKDLPLSTYTEAYITINLHNLLNFLRLRYDAHAQQEIREYAAAILDIVEKWVPIAHGAFVDYVLQSITFTGVETRFLTGKAKITDMTKRERSELIEKLNAIGWEIEVVPRTER